MTSTMNSQTTNEHAEITASPSSAPSPRTGHPAGDHRRAPAGSGTNFPHGRRRDVAQTSPAVGDTNLPETSAELEPMAAPSPAPNLLPSHGSPDSQPRTAGQDSNSQTTNPLLGSTHGPSSAPYSPRSHRGPDAQPRLAVGDTNLPETISSTASTPDSSPAPNFLTSQLLHGAQSVTAGQDSNSQTTNRDAETKSVASSAPYLPGTSEDPIPKADLSPASDSPHGHSRGETQSNSAVGGHKPAGDQWSNEDQCPVVSGTKPAGDQASREDQKKAVSGAQLPAPGHTVGDAQWTPAQGGFLRDPVLGLLADVLDDLEKVRIANENRVRQLTRSEEDSDGEERGFGLTLDNPMVTKLATSVEALAQAEKDATANLQKAMKAHPLGPWVKSQAGVGEKQAARLLATIGDPFWNDLHDRPRTVSELWAFCGYAVHDGHAQARRRGERSNWSADAKMRTYLISVSCVKQSAEKAKYRRVYDEGRAKYADAVHPHDCKRCGPAGKPALAGSPLSAGHQHNRAIRLISKELLKDLWIASRDLYLAKEA